MNNTTYRVPPAQLASRHLRKEWRKRFDYDEVPPLDLQQAVVTACVMCGYTKARVDKLIESYLKANPR